MQYPNFIGLFAPWFLLGSCLAQGTAQPPVPPSGTVLQGNSSPDVSGKPIVAPVVDFSDKAGNDWFESTRKHLGTFLSEEEAIGKFAFKNPRDVPHKFTNVQQSCQCSKAILRVADREYFLNNDPTPGSIWRVTKKEGGAEDRERVSFVTVNPGEAGEFEVHMAMSGFQGDKDATLDLHTSDEKMAAAKLTWRATGAAFFTVQPPEWHLNEMVWSDKREFQFEVSSPLRNDFNLLSHDPLPKKMEIKFAKQMRGEKAVWVVSGVYGPGVDERDGGGTIVFKTDIENKNVTLRVSAMVKGPLEMKPGGFVNLGVIRAGAGTETSVILTPNGEFELEATKLEAEKLSVDSKLIEFVATREGKDLKVTMKVSKDVQKDKIVRGLLKIHLNHPACPVKEVQFTGFVR